MSSFLILPFRHGLMPLAWRLRSEGHTVEVLPRSDRYERAWDGLFEQTLTGGDKRSRKQLEPVLDAAKSGDFIVVTDAPKWMEMFSDAEHLFGCGPSPKPKETLEQPLQIGSWWDGSHQLPHLIARDIGARDGGMGAQVTCAAIGKWLATSEPLESSAFHEGFKQAEEQLKDYKGLWTIHVDLNDQDELIFSEVQTGWDIFQTQLILAKTDATGALFTGGDQQVVSGEFSAVSAISVPPWPVDGVSSASVPITGPNAEQRRSVGWFDVRFGGPQDRVMETAELDGLVGVVRGTGSTPQWAVAQTIQTLASFEMPERQFRSDLGLGFGTVMTQLGRLGLV